MGQRTLRDDPVTGESVPDESARRTIFEYVSPRCATWPDADFIIGNPPFLGNKYMRTDLGDGYTETLRRTFPGVPESADYVMYWWYRASESVRAGRTRRFGFIATNSLRQSFNRAIVVNQMRKDDPISIIYAIPDHPWVDSRDGAAVRISMTVGERGRREGILSRVTNETAGEDYALVELSEKRGFINADLTVGPNVAATHPLRSNEGLSCPGVKLHGAGFIVTPDEAVQLGLGRVPGLGRHIRQYRHSRDITAHPRGVMVIDLFGLSAEDIRSRFPEVYQRVHDHVKPERDHNNRSSYRDIWWIHGEPRPELRSAIS
jgi:hypothetical protein